MSIYTIMRLTGTGPLGEALGSVQDGNGKLLMHGDGTTAIPYENSDFFDFDANVGTTWTLVAIYQPTISIKGTRRSSSATAYDAIVFYPPAQ